jgi:hypothetical protein
MSQHIKLKEDERQLVVHAVASLISALETTLSDGQADQQMATEFDRQIELAKRVQLILEPVPGQQPEIIVVVR